jgi:glycosyltransferase involved in cell wall biosynthesis
MYWVRTDMESLRVAIVHDWLVTYAGAERVLEQMLACYPEADLFSMVDFLQDGQRGFLQGKKAKTSFIQRLPWAQAKYRSYLPLMPLAVEQLDVSGYDVVISSSHAVAKGVLVGPDQLHLCMCYSPIRYAWDLQHQYLKETGLDVGLKGWLARWMLHKIRMWDIRTAHGVDQFVAISEFIARRIQKTYRREAAVIYPPVDVASFEVQTDKEDFYLAASRMVPYKKMLLIVQAFANMPDKQLVLIGDGPDLDKVKSLAGANVKVMGYQSFAVLKDHMQRAKAFVFAAEEDFGIAPLEAQACGTPVIAFGKGGALETIRGLHHPQPTGVFFEEQSVQAIVNAVQIFERNVAKITPQACRANAVRFAPERFRQEFTHVLNAQYGEFSERKHRGVR